MLYTDPCNISVCCKYKIFVMPFLYQSMFSLVSKADLICLRWYRQSSQDAIRYMRIWTLPSKISVLPLMQVLPPPNTHALWAVTFPHLGQVWGRAGPHIGTTGWVVVIHATSSLPTFTPSLLPSPSLLPPRASNKKDPSFENCFTCRPILQNWGCALERIAHVGEDARKAIWWIRR